MVSDGARTQPKAAAIDGCILEGRVIYLHSYCTCERSLFKSEWSFIIIIIIIIIVIDTLK